MLLLVDREGKSCSDFKSFHSIEIIELFQRLMRSMIHICAITHHRLLIQCKLTVPLSAEIDDYRKRKEIESRVNEISGEKINNSLNGLRPLVTSHFADEICNESEIRSLLKRASVCVHAFFRLLSKIGFIQTKSVLS